MLFRRPAAKLCVSCSQDLLRPYAHVRPQASQHVKCSTPQFRRRFLHRGYVSVPRTGISSQAKCGSSARRGSHGKRLLSTATSTDETLSKKEALFTLIDDIHAQEEDIVRYMHALNLVEEFPELVYSEDLDLVELVSQVVGHRNEQALQDRVRSARQQYGESLPQGELTKAELALYTRLYGEPIVSQKEVEVEEPSPDVLFRDDGEGGLVEVEIPSTDTVEGLEEPEGLEFADIPEEFEDETLEERTNRIASMLGGEVVPMHSAPEEEVEERTPRMHPLTAAGKFSSVGSVSLPFESMVSPVSEILSNFSRKHVADAAHRIFGGPHLPYSTSTTPKLIQKKPIPIDAAQRHMTDMEANAYIAALYPGIYASVMSVLVEVRKRLGSEWLRGLFSKEGGPKVLDAGAGGAGVLAWREILKAEWSLMSPDHPETSPIPVGKSTVVTGSDALRWRASALLENTTFLPRLPDYVHVRDSSTLDDDRPAPKRKQFDMIIAPHTLWPIEEDYMRKEYVQNLWSLLNPEGGVLILLEKGSARGFEAVAGAREMILDKLVASPDSAEYESQLQTPDTERFVQKEKGMIIAPCTNHSKCPMYTAPGTAKARKDFCFFHQRYTRPRYLQQIRGAKESNHEDVPFSYVAIQRGVDLREKRGIVQGPAAVDAAFAGHEVAPGSEKNQDEGQDVRFASSPAAVIDPLSLPRIIYSPMKRKGHVTMDLCTPAGKMERWTVPRSFSKQAYRDARKSAWGDLWALGAKTRLPRNLKLGNVEGNTGDAKRDRQANKHMTRMEAEETEEAIEEAEDFTAAESEFLASQGIDVPDFQRIMNKFDRPRGGIKKMNDKLERKEKEKQRRKEKEKKLPMWKQEHNRKKAMRAEQRDWA